MDFSHWFLLFCALLVFSVFGEIWFVQLVVYPLFSKVGASEYLAYHRFYTCRIPLPVILPGFASFFVPIALLFLRPESVPRSLALVNVGCGLLALYVTVALEIPRHTKLENGGKQENVIQELILYNWPRTLAITGSACCTLAMLTLAVVPV